jgi:hypothetical protein
LLERLKEIAAKPPAATLWRLTLRRTAEAAEIEELRGGRPTIPTRSAITTASTASGPVSVNTRKKDFGFRIRLGRNGL